MRLQAPTVMAPRTLAPAHAAQRDPVKQGDVIPDLGSLPNDNAHSMVNEHSPADARARMNFDARHKAGRL